MNAVDPVPQPLIAVGRNCDCGSPLVWRNDERWCAVYGSHPTYVTLRTPNKFGSDLIAAVMAHDAERRALWAAQRARREAA